MDVYKLFSTIVLLFWATPISPLIRMRLVTARSHAWSSSHKKPCTCKITAGTPCNLCFRTMLAFRLRNTRRPRRQRLTQCFTARTEATISIPQSLTAPGRRRVTSRRAKLGRDRRSMLVTTPVVHRENSWSPRGSCIKTSTSIVENNLLKRRYPKQSHAMSTLSFHALRGKPNTSHARLATSHVPFIDDDGCTMSPGGHEIIKRVTRGPLAIAADSAASTGERTENTLSPA